QLFAQRRNPDLVDTLVFWSLVLVIAQFFIRPALTMMFDGQIASATYRETVYYNALHTTLSIGSLFFGAGLIAAAVKDLFADERHRASVDSLSGLLLRGEFENRVGDKLAESRERNVSVALVIGDIDHFKQVNDIWGHQVGDQAISSFGAMISSMIRDTDIAGRIGGEEFCVLVWDVDQDIAARLAERLRVQTTYLQIGDQSLDVRLTASFGVAQQVDDEDYRSLFNRADKALYQAKQNERNTVMCAAPVEEAEEKKTPTLLASPRSARKNSNAA
ncbi:MAG: GGDEF domain-containing protein, partial [Pseudomonadota bacterium]